MQRGIPSLINSQNNRLVVSFVSPSPDDRCKGCARSKLNRRWTHNISYSLTCTSTVSQVHIETSRPCKLRFRPGISSGVVIACSPLECRIMKTPTFGGA
eukprot:c2559_g1_i1 orf=282-578(+)